MQRYYSTFIDSLLSIQVNFFARHRMEMKKEDCLGYILFCSLICNGSQVIAEITRMIEDDCLPLKMDHSSEDLYTHFGNFFDTLCFLGDQMFFKSVGSCRNPRHTVTSNGKKYDFDLNKEDLIADLNSICDLREKKSHLIKAATINLMKEKIVNKRNELSRYNGMGMVVAHNYVQLCSLCGLLPLQCYHFAASINQKMKARTGPNKILSKCLSFNATDRKQQPKHIDITDDPKLTSLIFDQVFSTYNKIWKGRMRKGWYENTLCKLNQVIESCLSKESRNAEGIDKLFKLINLTTYMEVNGSTKDNVFIYQGRKFIRQIQAQFKLDYKTASSQPFLLMSSHLISRNGAHVIETIPLTSWEKPGIPGKSDKRQQIGWSKDDTLVLSDMIAEFYRTDWSAPCGMEDCDNECCKKELEESKGNRISKTEVPVNASPKHKFFRDSSQNKTIFSGIKGVTDTYPDAISTPTHLKDEWLGEYKLRLSNNPRHEDRNDEGKSLDSAMKQIKKLWNLQVKEQTKVGKLNLT